MSLRLRTTKQFDRDLKTATKRGKNLDKLWAVVESLINGEPLAARHRPHRLSGNWSPCWECHIEPDWLLIWPHPKTVTSIPPTIPLKHNDICKPVPFGGSQQLPEKQGGREEKTG